MKSPLFHSRVSDYLCPINTPQTHLTNPPPLPFPTQKSPPLPPPKKRYFFKKPPISQFGPDEIGPGVGTEGFGTLDGDPDGAVDDQLRQDAHGPRGPEEDGIEVGFAQTVMVEEDPGVLFLVWGVLVFSTWFFEKEKGGGGTVSFAIFFWGRLLSWNRKRKRKRYTYGVDVGIGILHFAVLFQDQRGDFVHLAY